MTVIDTPPTIELVTIALDDLHPADDNPRHDLGDLTELAASITSIGILQPLVVVERHVGGGYTIVAGHRRHAAARIAGVDTVPCVVRSLDPEQRQTAMLVENLQRRDLDPLDEAAGFRMLSELGLSQRDIAERVGCNQSHVSRRLALVKLPEPAVELLRTGALQVRQAEQLAALPATDVDDVVAKVSDRSARDGDGALPGWIVDDAIGKVTKDRKRAAAIAAGEASGKKLAKTRPYQGAGDYRPCKKAEATHWYVDPHGTTVEWCRTAKADSKARGDQPATPSTYELERRARQEAEKQRIAQLLAVLDADESVVLDLGLGYLVDKVCGNGWHARFALDGTELHDALADSVIADLTDDRPLFVAVATLVGIADRGIDGHRFDGDDEIVALWARIAELADADGIGGWVQVDKPESATNEQFALVDGTPAEVDESDPPAADVVQSDDEPQVEAPDEVEEIHLDVVHDGDTEPPERQLNAHSEVVDERDDDDGPSLLDEPAPIAAPKRPWATYDGNDVARINQMATSMTVVAGVQEILDYELVNGGRAAIIDHCRKRIIELEA